MDNGEIYTPPAATEAPGAETPGIGVEAQPLFSTDAQPAPDSRPSFLTFQDKINNPTAEYTPQEAFYVEHGWKAYLGEFGNDETSFSLRDIARGEHLDPSEIKHGIGDGFITEPGALQLYGQMHLDQEKLFWTRHEIEHALEEPEARTLAQQQIRQAEAECIPLIEGEPEDLADYSHEQAVNIWNTLQHEADKDKRESLNKQYKNWKAYEAKQKERVRRNTQPEEEQPEQIAIPQLQAAQ